MIDTQRSQRLKQLQTQSEFDVVILGGGVNGTCLYETLCRQGYKVLIADKNDFAAGTSQSSGMMIWGGLLYLRNLDLASVVALSADRDRMIAQDGNGHNSAHDNAPDNMRNSPRNGADSRLHNVVLAPTKMRYLPADTGRAKWWVHFGLWLYWFMGAGRRRAPRVEADFGERELLKPASVKSSLTYEEGFLAQSDARFVYRWLESHSSANQSALNYCDVSGEYNATDKRWQLNLKDLISGESYPLKSAMMVNCAGIWTDEVNAQFGITSPFRHAFSKGVYLGLPRDQAHDSSLVFDLGEHADVITHVPWGPVSLWGPTETAVDSIADGLSPTNEDIDYLLSHYERRYRIPAARRDIISVRCGIRPLAVDKDFKADCYPLDLSRRQEVVLDTGKPWISCYGGKLTGCARMAAATLKLIKKSVAVNVNQAAHALNSRAETNAKVAYPAPAMTIFPGIAERVVSAAWCAEHELCCTLDDYLRRRTNIAQWVKRGGLGENDCNADVLKNIALEIAFGDHVLAASLFENYRSKIENSIDPLLAH